MNAHLVISVLLCAATCETEQLRIWDGDSFLVGMQSGSERIRVQNIDAPEIDGNVFLRDVGEGHRAGDIVDIVVEDADDHDLYGVPA